MVVRVPFVHDIGLVGYSTLDCTYMLYCTAAPTHGKTRSSSRKRRSKKKSSTYPIQINIKEETSPPLSDRIRIDILSIFYVRVAPIAIVHFSFNSNKQKLFRHDQNDRMAMVASIENADFDFPPCSDDCKVNEDERRAISSKPSCAMAERCVSACAAYGKVCPCSARIAAHYACDAVAELKAHSDLFATEREDYVYLNAEDLVIHEKLGEGGFSNVNRCILTAGPEEGQEFAVKYLKRRAMVELHTFKHGAADLAIEAKFLHQLNHPNIVKLHGVTAGSVENNFASGRECGFFIVVDKLDTTLEKRVDAWRKEREQDQTGLMGRLGSDYRERKREELNQRLRIAYSIACAMEYLHSKGIIFRDLKPDNIGFDKVNFSMALHSFFIWSLLETEPFSLLDIS